MGRERWGSPDKQVVLLFDRNLELFDCKTVSRALVARLYSSEIISVFPVNDEHGPSDELHWLTRRLAHSESRKREHTPARG